MITTKKVTYSYLALCIMASSAAQAGFLVLEPSPAPAPISTSTAMTPKASGAVVGANAFSETSLTPHASQTSVEPALKLNAITMLNYQQQKVVVRRGKANQVSLKQAVDQIAPSDWKVLMDVSANTTTEKVSWVGGEHRRWLEVLDGLFVTNQLRGEADWTKRSLKITERVSVKATPSPVLATKSKANGLPEEFPDLAALEAGVTTTKPVPVQAKVVKPSISWNVKAGSTLHDTVTAWADKQSPKWNVVWGTELDYPIRADFTLYGEFLDAIAQIFNAYKKAPQPLYIDVHATQRLIYVSTGDSK